MDKKGYAIDWLIAKCSEKMKEAGYSQACISVHVLRWKLHLKPYMERNGTNVYESELGRKFLMEKLPSLPSSSQKRFKRSIRIIESFIEKGDIPKHTQRSPVHQLNGKMGKVVQEYLDYKLSQRCAMTTVENYKRLLSYFMKHE